MPMTADNTINLRPLWQMLADDTQTIPERAFRFHVLLANTVAGLADDTATRKNTDTIVLSGGVFNNRLLRRIIKDRLSHRQVREPRQLPCGDGGIAAGQALIAAMTLLN